MTKSESRRQVFGEAEVRRLIYNYGSAYQDVLRHVDGGAKACEPEMIFGFSRRKFFTGLTRKWPKH